MGTNPDIVGVRSSMPRWFCASVVLECLLLVRPATAIDYEYVAPEGCPDRASFERATSERLQYSVASSTVQRVVVTIERGERYRATVALHEPGSATVTRTLEAQDCAQAVEALALTTALAIDARTSAASASPEPHIASISPLGVEPEPLPLPPPPPPPPLPPPLPPPPAAVPAPPSSAAAPAAPIAQPAAPHDQETTSADSSAEVSLEALALELAVGGFVATAYAPRASFGPSVGLGVSHGAFEAWLVAFYGVPTTAEHQGAEARFSVFGARVQPCYALELSAAVSALGCGSVEFSGVWAEGLAGDGVANPNSSLAPYWAAGASAGLRGQLEAGVDLWGSFGPEIPLDPHRFRFSNANGNLHEYPPVAIRGQLGAGYRF